MYCNRLQESFREHPGALRTQVDTGVNAGLSLAKFKQNLEGAFGKFHRSWRTDLPPAPFVELALLSDDSRFLNPQGTCSGRQLGALKRAADRTILMRRMATRF